VGESNPLQLRRRRHDSNVCLSFFSILCLNKDLTLRAAVATTAVNALSFDKSDVLNDELFLLLRPRIFSPRISKPVLVAAMSLVRCWGSRAVVSWGRRGGTSSEGIVGAASS
jgi:hypothetical protein